jgi:hypothetical protein
MFESQAAEAGSDEGLEHAFAYRKLHMFTNVKFCKISHSQQDPEAFRILARPAHGG